MLNSIGVQTGFHYFPNHLLSKFKTKGLNLPFTENIYKKLITLPLHPDLKEKDINLIINKIKDFLT